MENLTNNILIANYLNAVSENKFDELPKILRGNLQFKGPFMAFQTSEDYISALRRLSTILLKYEVKEIITDGIENCAVYDLVTTNNGGLIPCAEWISIEDGKITNIKLVFNKELFTKTRAVVTQS